MLRYFSIILLLIPFYVFGTDTLKIFTNEDYYPLDKYIEECEDKEGKYLLNDIVYKRAPFVALQSSELSTGLFVKQVWYRLVISNFSGEDLKLALTIDNIGLNYVTFFDLKFDSLINVNKTGEFIPVKNRNSSNRNFTNSLYIKKGETKTLIILINNSYDQISSTLELYNEDYLPRVELKDISASSFVLGIIAILVLISLSIYIRLKKIIFILSTIYFFLVFLVLAVLYGYFSQFIFQNNPQIVEIIKFPLINLTSIFSLIFAFDYLQLYKHFPHVNWRKFLIIATSIAFASMVLSLIGNPFRYVGLILYLPLALGILTFVIYFSVKLLKKSSIAAKTLLFSSVPISVSLVLLFLKNLYILPHFNLLSNFHIVFAIHISIISYGLIELLRGYQLQLLDDLKEKNKHIEHQKFILSQKNFELETLSIASSKTNNSIAIYNRDGNIKWYNEEFINTYNAVISQVFKKKLRNITHLIPNKSIDYYFLKCGETKKPISFETMIATKDGNKKYFQTTLSPILNEQGNISNFVTIDSDITQINETNKKNDELQKRVMQMEKLESVGKLAGGIAHDFNNLLTPIIGFTDLILLEENLSENTIEDLNAIKASASRAKKLVNQILVFSNYFKPDVQDIQLKTIIDEVITLFRNTLPKRINFNTKICNVNLCLKADSTHIHQVVMNICKNAMQAITHDHGELSLKLEYIHEFVISSTDQEISGNYAKISVIDNGIGMSKDTLKKIFDPFFTTKPSSQGTGLGMSVVHGIVQKYDGYIDIKSEEGKGTEINVYLPVTVSKETPKVKEVVEEYNYKGSGQKIMLIDDEAPILNMLSKLLSNNNYSIQAFSDSLLAYQEFSKNPKAWDLIITDQTMPNMLGNVLCEKILSEYPDTNIILMTGYSEVINDSVAQKIGIKKLLIKPVKNEILLKEIKEIFE